MTITSEPVGQKERLEQMPVHAAHWWGVEDAALMKHGRLPNLWCDLYNELVQNRFLICSERFTSALHADYFTRKRES